LNFTNEPKTVSFKGSAFDLLEERELHGHEEIPPYGVCLARY
jgi:Beta-galactosidase C-terminal domain